MDNIRILANDGIHPAGQKALENAGFEVITTKVPQEDLPAELPSYDAVIVRSATKIRKDLIDLCPRLKVIARGGVGLDNIDVDYARQKGLEVYNTPAASSQSVAELVIAHALGIARFVHLSNRQMPGEGTSKFKALKKSYAGGTELKGKTMGIIGLGRIGQATARAALGLGMRVVAYDPYVAEAQLALEIADLDHTVNVTMTTLPLSQVLQESDILTLHVPSQDKPIIGAKELAEMKENAILINASRGGIVDEDALLAALDNGQLAGAGLDVFNDEPAPDPVLLNHPRISVTPHTGASTEQAQINIGLELADKIIGHFSS